MQKKVLIIAYYFPPAGGGGVQRVAKFAKYFPSFDWKQVVPTAMPSIYRISGLSLDYTLLQDIPQSGVVKRTKSIDFSKIAHLALIL